MADNENVVDGCKDEEIELNRLEDIVGDNKDVDAVDDIGTLLDNKEDVESVAVAVIADFKAVDADNVETATLVEDIIEDEIKLDVDAPVANKDMPEIDEESPKDVDKEADEMAWEIAVDEREVDEAGSDVDVEDDKLVDDLVKDPVVQDERLEVDKVVEATGEALEEDENNLEDVIVIVETDAVVVDVIGGPR